MSLLSLGSFKNAAQVTPVCMRTTRILKYLSKYFSNNMHRQRIKNSYKIKLHFSVAAITIIEHEIYADKHT